MNSLKRRLIFERLRLENPAPRTELVYASTFELLIAVILSAQATDKGGQQGDRQPLSLG
jgi:endonuclease-3